MLEVDPEVERDQTRRLAETRRDRDAAVTAGALDQVREVAVGEGNLLYPIKAALQAGATLGEVSGVLVDVFGRYRPSP